MKSIINITLLVIVALISCQQKKDEKFNNISEERTVIEKNIRNSIEWAQTKDTSLLYSIIANDSNYIEVDPENRVVKGIKDFKKAETFWLNPNFKAIRYSIRDLRISLSQSGDVAWWYCVLDDINEWKGLPACWMNTRWTGVMEKRDGKWKIVQMHFSFASEV